MRIVASNFMLPGQVDVEIPDLGLTVITGPNGCGKSRFAEAVAFGRWGQTLRGITPWRTGEKGELRIYHDGLEIVRASTKGGSKKLDWSGGPEGIEFKNFPTSAKAQQALLELLGPFDLWRKCSVFSSHDAALFSEATDSQRKALLEALLGIDKFDPALKRCREAYRLAVAEREKWTGQINHLSLLVREREDRLREAEEGLAEINDAEVSGEDPEILLARIEKLESILDQNGVNSRALHSTESELIRLGADERAELRQSRQKLERLQGGNCPTCEQPIPDEMVEELEAEIAETQARLEEVAADAEERLESVRAQIEECAQEARDLTGRLSDLREQAGSSDKLNRLRARFRETIQASRSSLIEAEGQIEKLEAASDDLNHEVDLLEACGQVLGLKGVRAHILGRSLSGLEAIANVHLSRIAHRDGLRLALNPYTENKSGTTSDSISLTLEGVGGGHGYKATSGGERRRVDVSLVLGLAEVCDAAHGRKPGTLWFDEVFDALDEEGVEAVSGILREMAEERGVVVISHSQALIGSLVPHAAAHIHVSKEEATAGSA